MARVWRDGQKHMVWIYRLLSTGTIDGSSKTFFSQSDSSEKIYQRQLTKQSLSSSVMDGTSDKKNVFTREELKDIFSLNLQTLCDTHDLLECTNCCQDGFSQLKVKKFSEKSHIHKLRSKKRLQKKQKTNSEVI